MLALLSAIVTSAGIVVLVTRVAALTRPASAEQLGLRMPDAPLRAVLLTAGAAAALAALAAVWSVLGGNLAGSLSVPPELDPRTTVGQIYDLPVRDSIPAGPALIASALARCVLPVVAGEILLRGFVFPALSGWKGPLPAAAVVAVLFGGLSEIAGSPGIAVLSIVLGGMLCLLYVATGSLLPGVCLAAAAAGAALGAACAMPPVSIALLAAGCAAAATLLAAAPLLPRVAAASPAAA